MTSETRKVLEATAKKNLEHAADAEKRAAELEKEAAGLRKFRR